MVSRTSSPLMARGKCVRGDGVASAILQSRLPGSILRAASLLSVACALGYFGGLALALRHVSAHAIAQQDAIAGIVGTNQRALNEPYASFVWPIAERFPFQVANYMEPRIMAWAMFALMSCAMLAIACACFVAMPGGEGMTLRTRIALRTTAFSRGVRRLSSTRMLLWTVLAGLGAATFATLDALVRNGVWSTLPAARPVFGALGWVDGGMLLVASAVVPAGIVLQRSRRWMYADARYTSSWCTTCGYASAAPVGSGIACSECGVAALAPSVRARGRFGLVSVVALIGVAIAGLLQIPRALPILEWIHGSRSDGSESRSAIVAPGSMVRVWRQHDTIDARIDPASSLGAPSVEVRFSGMDATPLVLRPNPVDGARSVDATITLDARGRSVHVDASWHARPHPFAVVRVHPASGVRSIRTLAQDVWDAPPNRR